jgi:hypothetical protein
MIHQIGDATTLDSALHDSVTDTSEETDIESDSASGCIYTCVDWGTDLPVEIDDFGASCDYALSWACSPIALHFFTIDRPSSGSTIDLDVSCIFIPIGLILASCSNTQWNIITSSDSMIEHIYLSGAEGQHVDGVPESMVEYVSDACGVDYTTLEIRDLLQYAEDDLGLEEVKTYLACEEADAISLFHVCHDGSTTLCE